jgi:hypothetical protein
MSRIVSSTNAAQFAKDSLLGCVLVDLDFASGHVRCNDGLVACTFGGNTYSPVGQFGGIEMIEETLDSIARPLLITLSGIDASLVVTAQNEIYQNRQVIVYVGVIDQSLGTLVDTPEIAWEGRMDCMTISIAQGKGTIALNCEHRLRREPRVARYTDLDQQAAHPGDTFFSFLGQIPFFKSQWGNQKQEYGGPPQPVFHGPYGGGHWGGGK